MLIDKSLSPYTTQAAPAHSSTLDGLAHWGCLLHVPSASYYYIRYMLTCLLTFYLR